MPIPRVEEHILVGDIGGTHTSIAIVAYRGDKRHEIVRHKTFASKGVLHFPLLFAKFVKARSFGLAPRIHTACIAFAGPVPPNRSEAWITNLARGFSASEIRSATGVEQVILMNDFEAVGFGLEILLANQPEGFVRLSRWGTLPGAHGIQKTAVIIGAGTGLGTVILTPNQETGRVSPISGEGGHADFVAVDEIDFRIAQWTRGYRNRSAQKPLECEKIVSGPGLVNIYQALNELEPNLAGSGLYKRISTAADHKRPGIIVAHARKDALCRRTLDIWMRSYARTAKNSAIFPLAPAGVFLAGGIAAKILPELQSGLFMSEFTRCDAPNIQSILRRTPVFVVMDHRIGLFGGADFAVNHQT